MTLVFPQYIPIPIPNMVTWVTNYITRLEDDIIGILLIHYKI